jgi:hypothetical protein
MPNPTRTTTYNDEINQPAHRPGMEKVVNRQMADDPRDASGNRTGDRPTVSAPTRSAFGPDSASAPAPKAAPPPAVDPSSTSTSNAVNAIEGKQREGQITDYVDKAAGSGS